MSMSNENLHTVVDTLSVIEGSSLIFWQKYVSGINLTFFDCSHLPVTDGSTIACLPALPENEVRILGHYQHTEYVASSDENTAYYSSLIVPIFQQLASRFNLTVSLFVSRGPGNVEQLIALHQNLSTAVDRVPFIYSQELEYPGLTCAPPLHLSNQLQLLTALRPLSSSVEDMFQVFSLHIWLIILALYGLCVLLDLTINHKSFGANRIWSTLINYFNVLLSKESQNSSYNRWLFIFWVLGCIPLVEFFRNDMIAKIVENKYLYIDSLEDLMKTSLKGLATGGDSGKWSKPDFVPSQNFEYTSVRDNFYALFNRTEAMSFGDSKWLEVLSSPKMMIKLIQSSVILEDELALTFFKRMLNEIIPVHASRESYLPEYITPICYSSSFKYGKEIEKLTRELFEKGFLTHWNNLKHDYYRIFGKRVFMLLAGDDVYDRLNAELEQSTEEQSNSNLFGYILRLYLFLLLLNCTVFALEMLYHFGLSRIKWGRPRLGRLNVPLRGAFNDRLPPNTSLSTRLHSSLSF